MKERSTWSVALIALSLGCGGAGGTEPGNPGSGPGSASSLGLARLTPEEYAGAVNDLFGVAPSAQPVALADSTGDGVVSAEAQALADHDSAFAIAMTATSAARTRALLRGAGCAPPAGDDGSAGAACAAAFIDQVAPLAFVSSGPVDAPTLAGLNDLYMGIAVTQHAGFSGGLAAVIEEVLQSPYFLYRRGSR